MPMHLPAGDPKILAIDWLDHLSPTVYANPRFRVHFTDGSDALTQSDASCAYGLGNPEFRDVPLAVWFTRAGRITHLMRADKYEENKPTRVIFRKFLDHKDTDFGDGIIALFPDIPDGRPGMVMSYMHVDAHGAASMRLIGGEPRTTRPATEAEYADLKRELEHLAPEPYRLKVLKRSPH